MQAATQWWLVSARPSGETNDAVQPGSRTVERRTRSSHCGVMSTPSDWRTAAAGKLSKVHMPSSAAASMGRAAQSARSRRAGGSVMSAGIQGSVERAM